MIKFEVSTKVTRLLENEGIPYVIFSDFKANPRETSVEEIIELYKSLL